MVRVGQSRTNTSESQKNFVLSWWQLMRYASHRDRWVQVMGVMGSMMAGVDSTKIIFSFPYLFRGPLTKVQCSP